MHSPIQKLHRIFEAAGLEDVENAVQDLTNQQFFDTATWALELYARSLGVARNSTGSYIQSLWKGAGTVTLEMLQAVCESWKHGEITASFTHGDILITFNGAYGVPGDLDSLKNAIEKLKPAHLAVVYAFKYLLIKDIHEVMTINEMQTVQMNQFAGGDTQ
jgi:hypothetical protein